MSHRSNHNLDRPPVGWTKEEFGSTVLTLESLSRETLLVLVERFGIRFAGGNTSTDDEILIDALIDDTKKEELIAALAEF